MIRGEVVETPNGFEWRIDNFLSLIADWWYTSPPFTYSGERWCLEIAPNRRDEYIQLWLVRESDGFDINVQFSLAIKRRGNSVEERGTRVFRGEDAFHFFDQFLSLSELERRRDELLPSGVLTVVCRFETPTPSGSSGVSATVECSYCKEAFTAENVSPHESKCTYRPIKCPECSDVVLLRSWYEHECQKETAEASLSDDLKRILLSGDHSDITVKVKGQEFRLHRSILAARSPYFDSMFKSNMKEKATGVVTIDDCDPDVFRSFIHFLYSGKVDKLSSENVCELYRAADKYQEDRLKKETLHFMLNVVPVDHFSDYFVLAFTYDEKELMQKCIELFATKAKEITRTVKWQTFLKEYPTQANELLIKVFDQLIK